jgi:gamma-glutamylcyclotransferase (GGCT)/AIG2-like uncharacterized protein YtfP
MILFGYGTLRSDLGQYSHPPGCPSLGFAVTPGELWYIQNNYGKWAGVKEVGKDSRSLVYGEIFEAPDDMWASLDRREGANSKPPYYYRKVVEVTLPDRTKIEATIYFAGPERTTWLEQVSSGNWKDWLDKQEDKSAFRR